MSVPSWLPGTLLAAFGALTLFMIAAAFFGHPRGASRYPWWLRALVFLFGPLLTLFFCVMGILEPPSPKDAPIFLGFTGGFALVGFPLFWELTRFGYAITPDRIEVCSPWRGRWLIPWAEVDALSYGWGWFHVASRKRGGFAIPLVATSATELLEQAEKHLTVDQLAGAIAGYTAVGRRFPYDGLSARSRKR